MTETDDIVARLREFAAISKACGWKHDELFFSKILASLAERDAQIERLTRDEARLRKAIAECAALTGGHADGATVDFLMHVPENVRLHVERLTRERDEALKELHMKWCMACGTLTNDDDCDCTMYNGDASLQELRPYIEEYQNSMRECLSKAVHERDEARAEAERSRVALLAQDDMWKRGILFMTAEEIQRVHDLRRTALTKGGENGQS